MHSLAYATAVTTIDRAHMSPFMSRAFAGLWMGDSVTSGILAAGCLWLAFNLEDFRSPLPVLLIACCFATAVVLFVHLGSFFAGYVFAAVTLALFASTLVARRSLPAKRRPDVIKNAE
jgi:hypothetical protein